MQRTAYMPLGLGPHVCLGKALSTIILTTMLAFQNDDLDTRTRFTSC